MVVLSTLCRGVAALGLRVSPKAPPQSPVCLVLQRYSSHGPKQMRITASRFQWNSFKDGIHFYIFLGVIPLTILTFCINIFIGPAQLTAIPEGYKPKDWEYSSHPITRFISRYMHHPMQQDYEKYMHVVYEESQKAKIVKLTERINDLMNERQDYQSRYFRPATVKYYRQFKEDGELLGDYLGNNSPK